MNNDSREYTLGIGAALLAAFIWGFLSLYWKVLDCVDSWVIILYRILLVGVLCFCIAWKVYGIKEMFKPLKQKGVMLRYFIAGLLITINWSTYIYAVNSGNVIETSIGYYMEPIIIALFGLAVLKEKMNNPKKISAVFGFIALIIGLMGFGRVPYIALTVAISFSIYTIIKKQYKMSPVLSLLYETMFLTPFALAAIIYLEVNDMGALSMIEAPYQYGLLLLAGVATATPLALFAYAANRISIITLGITEYISPSINLVVGIFMFHEPFDLLRFCAFVCIWIGLIFFTVGEVRDAKELKAREKLIQQEAE